MKTILTIIFIFYLAQFGFSQFNQKLNDAESAFKKADYYTAIELYTNLIIGNEPVNKYYVYYSRAYCHYYLKNYSNAESDIRSALKIKKGEDKYNTIKGCSYWLHGRIYSILDKKSKSLSLYKKASKYMESSLLFSTIAFKEIQLGKYNYALKHLNQSIKLDSNNGHAYSNRALVFLKLSEFNNARIDVNRAIELDENNPYAFKHSALIYIELKEYENACIELNKAKNFGYESFGNESDSKEVEALIKEYCKNNNQER